MINGYPTEEELRDRITRQLEWRGKSDTVALIWHGYLAGLVEWGLLEFNTYVRLTELLPIVGSKEKSELFADEPLTTEEEKEIEEYLQTKLKNKI